jgi:hypothetical protein
MCILGLMLVLKEGSVEAAIAKATADNTNAMTALSSSGLTRGELNGLEAGWCDFSITGYGAYVDFAYAELGKAAWEQCAPSALAARAGR